MLRELYAEIGFRGDAARRRAAIEDRIERCADDDRSIRMPSGRAADSTLKKIDLLDLAIEQHHRNLRPGFFVDRRTARFAQPSSLPIVAALCSHSENYSELSDSTNAAIAACHR